MVACGQPVHSHPGSRCHRPGSRAHVRFTHQDENFNNADLLNGCGPGSCMDYSKDPRNNTTPNQHDHDKLVTIYSHLDGAAPQLVVSPPNDDKELLARPARLATGRDFCKPAPGRL